MIFLLLSVLSSTVIFVTFKLFDRFKVNTLHAIVVNYIVASLCGIIAFEGVVDPIDIVNKDWFVYTAVLGLLFIIIFNLMAITTQRSGLSVVSVATKMSLVIPILFGLLYYKESLGIYKFIGIILALVAVYLASIKTRSGLRINRSNLIYPFLVFLGSGIIDTSLKYLEDTHVAKNEVSIFSSMIFATAAVTGLFILIWQMIKGSFRFEVKNVIGGIALGIPNYFSVYFLVKALRSDILESSGIFTVNNVAVVMTSTLVGILLFHEKLLVKNWIGIALAVISIFLVTLNSW
ncbi:MAG: DMT family transporter [Bacteroidia bacterium]|nr:DMT family transporter [Bacteroidia bacterium]MBT8277335.1 DMT family transporter [Bacteroidia bacterium]NNF30264.1 DMT family transporter [Flavobacteriaceae bacterium]NNK54271.1 DMT family transporter [Flavobacteriaceae bacterium]NNM09024.1 DMT family transporter [Flavobacteriaceae bacterium]